MASTRVVRLSQAKDGLPPILIQVTPKDGGDDLDFDLFGIDGEDGFSGKVRQRNLKKHRAKMYDGPDDEWSQIIYHVFGAPGQSSLDSSLQGGLEVKCSISGKDPKKTLSINFTNKVEDITQRLGTIELPQTDEVDDVDVFGWAAKAIAERDDLQKNETQMVQQAKARDEALVSLQKQIDELAEAKATHEKEMLAKFAMLLNEKKLKIRNMQRILSTAKTDQKKLKELQAVVGEEPRSATRGNKRSAEADPEEDDTDETDGFETMDVDGAAQDAKDPDSPQSRASTPSQSEPEEDDEDDLDARPKTRSMDTTTQAQRKAASPLPPRRDLPFQKKTGQKDAGEAQGLAKAKSQAQTGENEDEDEETASEASEL